MEKSSQPDSRLPRLLLTVWVVAIVVNVIALVLMAADDPSWFMIAPAVILILGIGWCWYALRMLRQGNG